MFVHVIPVHVMEMAVVKIIHVAVMTDPGVPAVGAMLVGMIGMMLLGAGFHHYVLSSLRNQLGPHCFSCRLLDRRTAKIQKCASPPAGVWLRLSCLETKLGPTAKRPEHW